MAALEKPITTQEELDAVIGERIARAKESAQKKPFNQKMAAAASAATGTKQAKDWIQ